jgi:hypothetical protein
LAALALGVWGTDNPDVRQGELIGISWLVRKMAGSSHEFERAIRDLETLEAHIRLAHFFLRLDEFETRGAFVGGRAGDDDLGSLAAAHEILIVLERANASFEKGKLRVTAGVLPYINATQ